MCVIVCSAPKKPTPSEDIIDACWKANKDGGGFYHLRRNEEVGYLRKGLMTLEEFKQALEDRKPTDDDLLILHFRIATHGGVNPQKTHPFPISTDLKMLDKLEMFTNEVFIHNGILSGFGSKQISDTQEFVMAKLYDKLEEDETTSEEITKWLDKETSGNRTITISGKKGIFHLSGTWCDIDDLKFSNSNHERYMPNYVPPEPVKYTYENGYGYGYGGYGYGNYSQKSTAKSNVTTTTKTSSTSSYYNSKYLTPDKYREDCVACGSKGYGLAVTVKYLSGQMEEYKVMENPIYCMNCGAMYDGNPVFKTPYYDPLTEYIDELDALASLEESYASNTLTSTTLNEDIPMDDDSIDFTEINTIEDNPLTTAVETQQAV